MNLKPVSIQSLTQSVALLGIGCMGVVVAQLAIAPPSTATPQPVQMAQSPSLQGNWRLANMTEPPFPTPMLPTGELTAEFSNGRISGSGGCNRFNGSYTTKGTQLKIGPLASTFKACEPPIMQQESRFFAGLQAAQRYEVNKDGLQIFYQTKQGKGVLRFTSESTSGSGSQSGSQTAPPNVRGLW